MHPTKENPHLISGFKKYFMEFRIKMGLLVFLFVRYKNPITFIKVLKGIAAFKSRFTIGQKIPKISDGRRESLHELQCEWLPLSLFL
jgi:hypothetical protein